MGEKIVRFSENSDKCYSFERHSLYFPGENKKVIPMTGYDWRLLELLVDNAGENVSRDTIIRAIKGENAFPETRAVDNHISNLRKILGKPLGKTVIKSVSGVGYRYVGLPAEVIGDELPRVLTRTDPTGRDMSEIIHREQEILQIEDMLATGNTMISISGFGGIGKTSLARILYSKLGDLYDSFGWVEYRGDLKSSFLATMEIEQGIDNPEKRWDAIVRRLRNDTSRKILYIDNVDKDAEQDQDPMQDGALRSLSGWPHTTIVLTSRLDAVPGYKTYQVGYLGSEQTREAWCIDLFYLYYNKKEYEKPADERRELEAVRALVDCAGYHTYAIELLAKGAKFENSLADYLKKIREIGFRFPRVPFHTAHKNDYQIAAEQLKKLFDLRTRTEKERRILWDFSVLPHTGLTRDEMWEWFGYTEGDVEPLVAEGWLTFKDCFFLHPLIKEAIFLDLKDGKAPSGTMAKLTALFEDENFVSNCGNYPAILRVLDIAQNFLKYVPIDDELQCARVNYVLGLDFFQKARRRLTAISCLEKAFEIYRKYSQDQPDEYLDKVAETSFQLGYIESATKGYREQCVAYLREAHFIYCCQQAKIDGKLDTDDDYSRFLEHVHQYDSRLAKVKDHLGYVLTDIPECRYEAGMLLAQAYAIWDHFRSDCESSYEAAIESGNELLAAQSKAELYQYLSALATTLDNLGRLNSFDPKNFENAEKRLLTALTYRKRLAEDDPAKHLTEVAWTCNNLGDLYAAYEDRDDDAEKFYREALHIREVMEKENPGMYIGNVAWTSIGLAKVLAKSSERRKEATSFCQKVLEMCAKLDDEHRGFFVDEIVDECQSLLERLEGKSADAIPNSLKAL